MPQANVLFHVLLALAAVIVAGQLLGRALTWFGQPPVIGEVLAGICLGPSLLGRIAPEVSSYILPAATGPTLGAIAQIGVVLYMFLVGLELSGDLLRGRLRAAVITSHTSIVVPFALGAGLATFLYSRLSAPGVPFVSFALFMGIAMSITAFPVLARILADRRMQHTELGVMALTCAAVDDVTSWCLLAFVVGVTQSTIESAVIVGLLTLGFIAAMFILVRPIARRVVARVDVRGPGRDTIALTLVGVLLSALITERIGVHAIFGAFLFGAVIPHDSRLARLMTDKLESLVTILLLPAFFAFTGLRTQIGLVAGGTALAITALIILVATVGKFGGTLAAARLTGMGWRNAASLGILMNTRGLMELIVLNIGLDLGVISPTLFTMMVIMALATTMATTPVLQWLHPALQSLPLEPRHRAAERA
jgi:Kef-type K+ transport system membrane component KefB